MGIDVAKLNELQQLVSTADTQGNKNGKIDTEQENSIFEDGLNKLVADGKVEENELEDIKGLFGYTSKPEVKTVTDAEVSKAKPGKAEEKYITRTLNTIMNENVELKDIPQALQDATSRNYTPEYAKLIAEVSDMISKVGTINSKSDVETIEKNLKKVYKNNKQYDDFHKDVIKMLKKHAETMQKAKEYDEVRGKFNEIYGKGGVTLEQAYKSTKEYYKNEKSYYKDALKTLEKVHVRSLADDLRYQAMSKSERTSYGDVRKDTNAELKKNGQYDKYTHIGHQRLDQALGAKEESRVQIALHNQKRANKVEKAKVQTEQEVLKALGGKKDVLQALVNSGLIERQADGRYDLSTLSAIIGNEVGADNYLDRSSKKFQAISEKLGTYTELGERTGLDDLTDDEAKKLVKMCGYEIEGKNWGKVLLKTTIGAAVGAVTAGGAEAGRRAPDYTYRRNESIKVTQHIETGNADNNSYKMFIDGKEVSTDSADSPIQLVKSGNGDVVVDVIINLKSLREIIFQGGKFVLGNALRGAVIGGLAGLADGLMKDDKTEIPVAEINFDCMSLKEYTDRVSKKYPEYADIFTTLAATFRTEDGEWDCEGYRAFLRKAAGNDILNKKELIAALQNLKSNIPADEVPEEKKPEEKKPDPEKKPEPEPEEKCMLDIEETHEDITVTHKIKFGDSWEGIVNAYYPTWKNCYGRMYGKDGAIRALKRALAVNEDGSFNAQLYSKLLAGYIPSSIKLPEALSDCKRKDDGQVKFKKPVGRQRGNMGTVGRRITRDGVTLTNGCDSTLKGHGRTEDEALADYNRNAAARGKKQMTKRDIVGRD